MNNSSNNKRIAKNTLFLYFRTIIIMCITLYTSRLVLDALGVVDFGIYNVVGGVVLMFAFLNGAMSAGTQRFLSFELEMKDESQLGKTFSTLVNIHVFIAIIIFILAETIGLWFLNNKLNIPADRMEAAQWVYQLSILSFMVTVTQVPYNGSIIAHEKMNIFAYISILEAVLKLMIVVVLKWISFDSLKLYGILVFSVTLIIALTYRIYCIKRFKECIYRFTWDKNLFKTLVSYSGWNMFGSGVALVVASQGINMLLNLFFGPVINTSRSIAYQVNSAINTFISSFQTAVKPQIIKSYANGDFNYMLTLIYQTSKYSFFLLFLLSLPVIFETKLVLMLWLNQVPEYAVLFCRLVLINTWIECFSGPIVTAVQATGRIKKYQIIIGILLMLNLPISYIFLKLAPIPIIPFYVSIILSILILIARLVLLQRLISFSTIDFINKVVKKAVLTSILPLLSSYILFTQIEESLSRFILLLISSIALTIFSIYALGLERSERLFLVSKIHILSNYLKGGRK